MRLPFHDIMIGLPHPFIVPRFYPVLDSILLSRLGMDLTSAAEAILEGGARILQLRHKCHFSREAFDRARQIARLCAEAQALLVINDRADVAALLNAGLHLGQDDLPPPDARTLLTHRLPIGFSTHNEQQLLVALEQPIDYIALGPIFATRSKDRPDPVVGLVELGRLRARTNRPLVAIGGITRESALAVLEAGVDAVAVIGDLLPHECTKKTLRTRTEQWVQLLKT